MKKTQLLLLTLSTALLSGCVDAEKNKLDNRVKDYWNFKIDKQFNEAYKFLSPGWKSAESTEVFQQRMAASKVNWIKAKMSEKTCSQPDLCRVKVDIEYEYSFKSAGSNTMLIPSKTTETWIMQDNIWYLVPEKKKIK